MKKYLLIAITSILFVSCGSGTQESSNQSQDSTAVSSDSCCVSSSTDSVHVDSLIH